MQHAEDILVGDFPDTCRVLNCAKLLYARDCRHTYVSVLTDSHYNGALCVR